MIAYFGKVALFFSMSLSLYQSCPKSKNIVPSTWANSIFLASAFFLLEYCHIISDFSIINVYQYSSKVEPLFYKITGVWNNPPGALLLFTTILSFCSNLFALRPLSYHKIKCNILNLHGIIMTILLAIIFFAANPFIEIFPIPDNGKGLNPILQNIGLALHMPLLYIGLAGIVFTISCSLVTYRCYRNITIMEIYKKSFIWLAISWLFLTFGLVISCWYAYLVPNWLGILDLSKNIYLIIWLILTVLLLISSLKTKAVLLFGSGIICIILGMICIGAGQKQIYQEMKYNEIVKIGTKRITLESMSIAARDNFLFRQGDFSIHDKNNKEITHLYPEVRYYPIEQINTNNQSVYYRALSNSYIEMGKTTDDGKFIVKIYYRPMINLIWIGIALISIGYGSLLRNKTILTKI